jgi:hypothetical protein
MTRCPQERTARALARFPVYRVVRGRTAQRSTPKASPLLDDVKASVSLLRKEPWSWNREEQKLCHIVLLHEMRKRECLI